jgi:hypothetical protein
MEINGDDICGRSTLDVDVGYGLAWAEAGGLEDGVHLVCIGHHQPHEGAAVAVHPADVSPRLAGDEPIRRRRRRHQQQCRQPQHHGDLPYSHIVYRASLYLNNKSGMIHQRACICVFL